MPPLLLLAALVGLGGGPEVEPRFPAALPPGPARVEVLEGRAALALSEAVVRLTEHSPEQFLEGPVHMEVSPRSRVRVSWGGLSSLLIDGAAVLEWTPPRNAGEAVDCRFSKVERTHIEVRRGRIALGLPTGWRADVEAGACFLRGITGETVELEHDAGLPISLWAPGPVGAPRPPFTLLAGSQVRLLPGTARPLALAGTWQRVLQPHGRQGFEVLERGERPLPWRGFDWPWGERSRAASNAIEPTPQEEAGLEPPSIEVPKGLAGAEPPTNERLAALDLPDRRSRPARAPRESPPPATPNVAEGAERAEVTDGSPEPAPEEPAGEEPPRTAPDDGQPAEGTSGSASAPVLFELSGLRLVMTPLGARWVPRGRERPLGAKPVSGAQSRED